jgi:DNA-binding response OmpR family regulator
MTDRVLVIDDEPPLRRLLRVALQDVEVLEALSDGGTQGSNSGCT